MAKLTFCESSDIITIVPETIEEEVNLSKFCEKHNWEKDEIDISEQEGEETGKLSYCFMRTNRRDDQVRKIKEAKS